jgi:quinolinate synthase
MKRITLPKILRSLRAMEHVVDIEPAIAERARQAVQRMIKVRPLKGNPNHAQAG